MAVIHRVTLEHRTYFASMYDNWVIHSIWVITISMIFLTSSTSYSSSHPWSMFWSLPSQCYQAKSLVVLFCSREVSPCQPISFIPFLPTIPVSFMLYHYILHTIYVSVFHFNLWGIHQGPPSMNFILLIPKHYPGSKSRNQIVPWVLYTTMVTSLAFPTVGLHHWIILDESTSVLIHLC
jgi:hypothetical protein